MAKFVVVCVAGIFSISDAQTSDGDSCESPVLRSIFQGPSSDPSSECVQDASSSALAGQVRTTASGECQCDKGYYRATTVGDPLVCTECDPGYFKDFIGPGDGGCPSQCSTHFGVLSTSLPGARSFAECFCTEGSHMRVDPGWGGTYHGESGYYCEACCEEGVRCPGGYSGDGLSHRRPVALSGFEITDVCAAFDCSFVSHACKTWTRFCLRALLPVMSASLLVTIDRFS